MVRDEAFLNSITEQIIGCAYRVANTLGPGFLEKVYENALYHEVKKSGLIVERQHPINVFYDGVIVGEFFADLLVEKEVIVELKAVKALDASHFAQGMNYLKGTGKKICLLINFGSEKVEIRRIVNF
ncbi:MAG: GxxExxY protein [Syntrophotaleaceae bacterium]